MSEWTQTDCRIGSWAATTVVAIVGLYIICGLIGVATRPPNPNPLSQVDPYLAILEILLSIAAVVLVILMAAVYAYAAPDRKTLALTALAFMIAFAILTCGVHFASLTVRRQVDAAAFPLLSHQLSFEWPTVALSLDLLAWDFFLGLSLAFAAPVFQGAGLRGRVRISMFVAGSLCLAGLLGPVSGRLQIQYLGIAGYILGLPVVCTLLAVLFAKRQASGAG